MARKQYPVVLRFEGMNPRDIPGFEAHRLRKGGDIGHVNRFGRKSRRLLGMENWAQAAAAEIKLMRLENFAAELGELDRRNRRKEIAKRRIEGPRDPWRSSRHGPMREVLLTVNREWFEQCSAKSQLAPFKQMQARERQFQKLAVAWLLKNFGNDVIHARADLDEKAYHIHAVIMPRAVEHKYGVDCAMLQPSVHPMIRNYEAAQDSVGEWFAPLGLVRGERTKQSIREALENGQEPPKMPRHVRPAEWRAQEELRLAKKAAEVETRARKVAAREEEAEVVMEFAEAVAAGEIDENGQAVEAKPERAPVPPERKASIGFQTVRKAFRAAAARLRTRARVEAKQAAEAAVANDRAEIRKADEVIVEIAKQLPPGLRSRIAQVRRSLTAQIMKFDPTARGRGHGQSNEGDGQG